MGCVLGVTVLLPQATAVEVREEDGWIVSQASPHISSIECVL
jgi:hypothetical protein